MCVSKKDNINYALIESEYYTSLSIRNMISSLRPNYKLIYTGENSHHFEEAANSSEIDLIIIDNNLSDTLATDVMIRVGMRNSVVLLSEKQLSLPEHTGTKIIDCILKPITATQVARFIDIFENMPQVI